MAEPTSLTLCGFPMKQLAPGLWRHGWPSHAVQATVYEDGGLYCADAYFFRGGRSAGGVTVRVATKGDRLHSAEEAAKRLDKILAWIRDALNGKEWALDVQSAAEEAAPPWLR